MRNSVDCYWSTSAEEQLRGLESSAKGLTGNEATRRLMVELGYMGRGPKAVHAHLVGDLLVVRLQGVLTAAEQHLVQSLSPEKVRDLLKQVRTHLVETTRPVMEAMAEKVTGVKVLSLHQDTSTVTGEEFIALTPADLPLFGSSER